VYRTITDSPPIDTTRLTLARQPLAKLSEKVFAQGGRRLIIEYVSALACVLAEARAEATVRRPNYRHRLSAENPTDVGRRPREPVNCV
jgi:hypothetical protein